MPRKTTAVLLAVAAVCAAPLWAQGGLRGAALETALQGQAALTREEGRPLKAQAAGAAGLRGELPVTRRAALGLGLDGHATLGSSLSGGWQYAGHLGAGLRLYGRLHFPLGAMVGQRLVRAGGATGVSLNYDRYTHTDLYFFYPGWFLEPQLELQLRPGGRTSLGLSVPLDVYFRRDLQLSAAAGLAMSFRLYRKGRP